MEGLAPPEVRDAAEFTAALRELRVRTNLSYRQLERRAEKVGDVLPASTLSTALSRNTLPREQLLTAYIRACGGDDQAVEAWAALRADLAVASVNPADRDPTPTDPAPAAPTDPAPAASTAPPAQPTPAADSAPPVPTPGDGQPPPRTRRRLTMVAGVLAIVAAVALAVVLSDGTRAPAQNNAASTTPTATTTTEPSPEPTSAEPSSQPPTTTTAPPPAQTTATAITTTTTTVAAPQPPPAQGPKDGIQRIRLVHSGLCVGEGPEQFTSAKRIVLGQHDCATATPPTELERLPDGTYRIKLHNAQYGLGCATMDYGGTRDSLLLAGDDCGANRADQKFTLEPASGGYRLRSVPGSAYCIGVLSGRTDSGVQLIQNTCNGQANQLFVLG